MILFRSFLIDNRVVDRKVPIKFDHFTSLSRRERERNVSKWKNARAGRAELLFLFIKPIGLSDIQQGTGASFKF